MGEYYSRFDNRRSKGGLVVEFRNKCYLFLGSLVDIAGVKQWTVYERQRQFFGGYIAPLQDACMMPV